MPDIDVSTYELELFDEESQKEKTLTMKDVKKYPKHTITATIMCAGNRRSEMTKVSVLSTSLLLMEASLVICRSLFFFSKLKS